MEINGASRRIGNGLVVLVGISVEDTDKDVKHLVDKIVNLRIFSDENGKLNFSALELKVDVLVVSNFTLMANIKKGRRPSFPKASTPKDAKSLFENMLNVFRETGLNVVSGYFGQEMTLYIENNGPVTLTLDTSDIKIK